MHEVFPRFSEPIFPEADHVAQSLPGYASLHRNDDSNGYSKLHDLSISGEGPYSKLDRGGAASSSASMTSNEYGRLQHSDVPQEIDVSFLSSTLAFTNTLLL